MDRNIMQDFREIMLESHLEENDWKDTVYTFVHLKAMISARLYEVFREADLYQDAPNGDVIKPDLSKTRLLEYQKKDRPLVLNFGSSEAHPSDGWKFKNNFDIDNHKRIQNRMKAVETLRKQQSSCEVVADDISNDLNYKYGAMFERLFIVLNGKVVYLGQRGPQGYHLEEVEEWLTKYTS
uniref:Iodothyronine deiodinase n=1 Tax=Magallana gigas TaxID=29159 RepID=A0A8W8HUT9_MAGGI